FIRVAGRAGLLSWGGTMFEYLLPRLFLQVPAGTLLDSAWEAAVARQIEYGRQTGTAWGVSESAYNLTDAAGNFQYQAFGVPGLGLKRGLGRDLVVAPYACAMALPVVPHEALANLRRHAAEGAEGKYGLYEAIDHTPQRLPPGQKRTVIRSYMAHHQGMTFLAIAATLQGPRMAQRLAREPAVRAVELLLQERVPLDAPTVPVREPAVAGPPAEPDLDSVSRRLTTPTPREPRPHFLSNGRYTVMLTSSGSGYSKWRDLDVTRWRADPTADRWGQFLYVRDAQTGEAWSATHQPLGVPADWYEAIFALDKVDFRQRRGGLETLLEVAVTPEFDAELRRLTVTNFGDEPRELELTSYAEVALASHAADLAHPAFHKLFLQTERLDGLPALLCRRRPRGDGETVPYAVQVLAGGDGPTWETDRARFLGRRNDPSRPEGLTRPLSGTLGAVLDPAFVLRCRVTVPAGGRAVVCFTTGVAGSRELAEALADRFSEWGAVERAFELAWAHSRVELKHLDLSIREAQVYQRFAGFVLYPPPGLRASADILRANRQGQSGLWRHGISGDLPIVVIRVRPGDETMGRLRRVMQAHSYWAGRGLATDLVLLNDAPTSYHDELQEEIMGLFRSGPREKLNQPGGVFVRKVDQFSPDDLNLLLSWARMVVSTDRSALEEILGLSTPPPTFPPPLRPTSDPVGPSDALPVPEGLQFFNGTGGFSADGREYVLVPGRAGVPPMPWVNVIANARFGTLVSDSGAGYTWAGNSQLNRLTPWHNDPVSDAPGEALYLRDERSGEVWSPTPLPAGGSPTLV
ncbi:MAG: glucoamylase family protein, partial [Gemmataceae bacterium]